MPTTTTHTLATLVHGTYLVDPPGDSPTAAVFGFHGYGETAEVSLAALRRLRGSRPWLLCAVQGLHPFYRKTGEVVAGWMTKFDRDNAIADNVRWTAAVIERVQRHHPTIGRRAFVGFSQGVAMAYRAANGAGRPGHALVALAGDVPPDVAATEMRGFPPVLIGRGSEEQWYTEEKLADDVEVLEAHSVEVEVCRFDGGHEWDEAFVTRAGGWVGERLEG